MGNHYRKTMIILDEIKFNTLEVNCEIYESDGGRWK
jgi:hypothetical protein